jgi:Cell wall-active antibiotics response 4TMS YvqF
MVQPPTTRRRSPWLVAATALAALIVLLALVAVIVAFTWFDVSLSDGVGDRSYAPTSGNGVRREYKLGVGNLKLDLSHVPVDKELHVEARVGIGELRVIVPRDASAAIDARVKAGSVSVLGHHEDGRNARIRVRGGSELFLTTRVGAGGIDVTEGQ